VAEDQGAHVAFIAEDVNCRDSFELCALSAWQTERIQIGTGVVNPYTRNPTSLAMAAATLDEISGGRAILGIGTSSPHLIQGQMGLDVGKSAHVIRESASIVRRLLSGEPVSFEGERFRYREAALQVPVTREHIPIFFAAMGPVTLRTAGEIADGVLLNVGASLEYVRWAVEHVREGALRAGRDPGEVTIAAWISTYVTNDHESALARARQWLATMLSIPRQGELLLRHGGFDPSILPAVRQHVRAYPHSGNPEAAALEVPPEYAHRMAVIGTRERVLDRLQEYRDAGVDIPVVGFSALRKLL